MAALARSLQKAVHTSRNTDDFNTYFGCPACIVANAPANTHGHTPKKALKYVEVPFNSDLQYTDKVARALSESTGLDISCDQLFSTHDSSNPADELSLTCVDENLQEIVLITKPPRGTRMHFV